MALWTERTIQFEIVRDDDSWRVKRGEQLLAVFTVLAHAEEYAKAMARPYLNVKVIIK